MSHRWSYIKRFGRITREEFLEMAYVFIRSIRDRCQEPMVVNLVLYRYLPHSVSAPEDDIQEWVASENKKKELTRAMFLAELSSLAVLDAVLSPDDFELAASIQLTVRLVDDKHQNYTFGQMECKGLLPRHVVFYFQSAINLDCCNVEDDCIREYRPSKIMFGLGDGFEKCHPCSPS